MRHALWLIVATVSVVQAQSNWPHWRGPNADGTAPDSANPPTTWDGPTGKNIAWTAEIPGQGSATPIVWGNRVFVLSAKTIDKEPQPDDLPVPDRNFPTQTERPKNFRAFLVLCYDLETGKMLWERTATTRVPHEGTHTTHNYAGGSPTTDGTYVYACFGSYGVYCYKLDGTPVWQRDLGLLHSRRGWGEAVTPVIHGDSLILNWDQEADSKLYCLDAKTGKTRWVADRDDKSSWNTPLIVEHDGTTQVILNGVTAIRSYDLANGKQLWSRGGMTVNPIPSPIRVGDMAVIMSGYRGSAAVAVPLNAIGNVTDGDVRWTYNKATPYVPSPTIVDGKLYFLEANSNLLTVLDAKTGEVILDRERLPGVTSFYASPVYAGGNLYFIDRRGTCVVLKPGDKLDVVAVNHLNATVDASPVPVGNRLLIRGTNTLYCIMATAAAPTPAGFTSPAAVARRRCRCLGRAISLARRATDNMATP